NESLNLLRRHGREEPLDDEIDLPDTDSANPESMIGGGIAVAAALIALSYTIDFPPGAQNTVGTIVPAQRFHAAQPTADEIKVGGQSATQSVPLQAGSAGNAAANNAVSNATDKVVNQAADKMVNQATDKS